MGATTTGISEARNVRDEMLGDTRLISMVEAISQKTLRPEDFSHMLVDEVDEFETGTDQADDLTVLVIHRNK